MVTHKDKNCFVEDLSFFESIEDGPNGFVDSFDGAVITGKLRVPTSRKRPQIIWHKRVFEFFRIPLWRYEAVKIVLMMWFKLRDDQQKRIGMLLFQEANRQIGEKIHPVFVLERDGRPFSGPQGALIWLRSQLKHI